MPSSVALILCLAFIGWALYRDTKSRPSVSLATWLPTFWVAILASRSISMWLTGGAIAPKPEDALEGSPIDRLVYLGFMVAALTILQKRQLHWGTFIRDNKAIILLYAYLALTVLWAASPYASFKRLFKDFANVLVALVILTDSNPREAFRAVFVRCGYLLLPLSILTIRYFPHIGRFYNPYGLMEEIGVACQKNGLGAQVLVTSLVIVWDIFHRLKLRSISAQKLDLGICVGILLLGMWLFMLSDSKTSMVCLLAGVGILASIKVPFIQRNATKLVGYVIAGAAAIFVVDKIFGVTEWFVTSLGRDMTFTGRTDIWEAVLGLGIDRMWGSGYWSMWTDPALLDRLPPWVAFGRSAHNGYVDMFLDGGWMGIGFLATALLAVAHKVHRQMRVDPEFGCVRLAILIVTIAYNLSESVFVRLGPIWFMFLLAAIEYPRREQRTANVPNQIHVRTNPALAQS